MPSTIPGVAGSPIGAPPTVIITVPLRIVAPTDVPLSSLSVPLFGLGATSNGPVAEPFLPLELMNFAGGVISTTYPPSARLVKRYEPWAFVAVVTNAGPSGTPSPLASANNDTVTPAIPSSPASTTPLLLRSFHTKLPSVSGMNRPKSTVWLELSSGVVVALPPTSPVGSPPAVRTMPPLRMTTPVVVPSSLLSTLSSGDGAGSDGPVVLPFLPVLLR